MNLIIYCDYDYKCYYYQWETWHSREQYRADLHLAQRRSSSVGFKQDKQILDDIIYYVDDVDDDVDVDDDDDDDDDIIAAIN